MFPSSLALRIAIVALMLGFSFVAQMAHAAPPSDATQRAALIGQPAALLVQPEALRLNGPRSRQQVIVTGRYGDGSVRDLTGLSEFTCESAVAGVAADGFLTPLKNGTTSLIVKAGPASVKVPVIVADMDRPQPVSFRHEFIAALNVGGCNAGACHGTPSGKNGFKLSLRGFDPAADFVQLTHDVQGRRTDRHQPEMSLAYQKALGRVPHDGMQRFPASSVPARAMRDWIAEGSQNDPANLPALKAIQILPGSRILKEPARWQQLAVLAHFADGAVRDVTRLTVFSSSDANVAEVNCSGLVEFKAAGEVAILCRYLEQLQTVRLMFLQPREGFVWPNPPETNFVDKHVFAKLKMLSIPPSDLCSDSDYVRRAYLDVCGILPTPDEVRTFMDSHDPAKRAKLVDALLERPEFADFWTLKWGDILRSNRKTIQVKGVHVFQKWLRGHIEANTGFDQIVKELLTANGSTFANPPANYYRVAKDPQNLAETTVQLFFGIRMQCAKCHNHPFERWSQDDYYSMAAFFARVKQKPDTLEPSTAAKVPGAEVVYSARSGEVTQPRTGKTMPPKFMGGAVPALPPGKDRREVLADWIVSPENPFFAKSTVNRIWFHLCGKGIVDPVDDFRDSNPSANDELLDALAKDFIAHKYDLRHTIKVIMASRTYQLAAQANDFNKDDTKYFSHAVVKLLTAEQLLDAICVTTQIPEKFTGMPLGTHAVQLPDGDANHPFLKTFNQPARELACECERESDSNLSQALQLINGPTVNDKLRNPNNRIGKLMAKKLSDKEMVTELYLATLSRTPTDKEMELVLQHISRFTDKRKAWEDVHWAFLNTKEFLFRH